MSDWKSLKVFGETIKKAFVKAKILVITHRKSLWDFFVIMVETTGAVLLACSAQPINHIILQDRSPLYVDENTFEWGIKLVLFAFVLKVVSIVMRSKRVREFRIQINTILRILELICRTGTGLISKLYLYTSQIFRRPRND